MWSSVYRWAAIAYVVMSAFWYSQGEFEVSILLMLTGIYMRLCSMDKRTA